jgi:hypothetical protein
MHPAALREENPQLILPMKNKNSSRSLAAAATALIAFGLLSPLAAQARERSTQTTGPRGGTLDTQVTRTPGNFAKASTYTSPSGKVSTRNAARTYNPATGAASGSASTTLANGKTASSSFSSVKTDTGRSTTGQATGFNGQTSTYDSTKTNTANGFTRVATLTGPNGGTITKDVDVTKQDGSVTRTATVTKTPPPKS